MTLPLVTRFAPLVTVRRPRTGWRGAARSHILRAEPESRQIGSMSRLLCSLAEIGRYGKDLALPGAAGTHYLMLFRDGDRVVGFHNVCPHQGRGLNLAPDRFHFTREGWLMCAHHGASFDLATGRCVEGPCRGAALKPLELEIRNGEVWLAGELA